MQIVGALKLYYSEYGVMPQGNNAGLMDALRRDNPRKIAFLEVLERDLDVNGEFVDPWKSPYRIDVSEPEFPRAYSCGKNRLDDGGRLGSDDICSWQ